MTAPRPSTEVSLIVEDLIAAGATVATAESLTGGRVAAAITAVPGASRTYLGGVVSYSTEVKVNVLGVPTDLVEKFGVISAECAAAMAIGVRDLLGSTHGVATTGVAGPGGQEGRAVGTVFVAVAGPTGVETVALALQGSRAEIQSASVTEALGLLRGILRQEEPRVR